MPSADDLIPDFDDFEATIPKAPISASPPTASSKKSRKKAKKHVVSGRARLDEEEDTPYPKSITPSPPAHHGVKLNVPSAEIEPEIAVQHAEPDLSVPRAEATFEAVDFDHDIAGALEPEPEPATEPAANASPVRTQSPQIRSPPPQPVHSLSPPVSPPYRPASLYTVPRQHSVNGSHRPNGFSTQQNQMRRESFTKQAVARPRFMDPPPPHMAQPHFFGVPDLGLNLAMKSEPGKPAGADGYCCRFDSFADAGDSVSARKAKDALLVGSEGGLDVYRVLPDKLEVVGRLEGVRGAVIDAKVIPHIARNDGQQALRPLVVLVLHGPSNDSRHGSGQTEETQQEFSSHFQTTVEVYSLKIQQHVATLYQSVPVATEAPVMGHLSLPPAPVGDLCLAASASVIIVASGKSGEVFVFSCAPQGNNDTVDFRCIGKFWTSLQQGHGNTSSRPPSSAEVGSGDSDIDKRPGVPLFSLSNRWLAVMPPYISANTAIQGSPLVSDKDTQPQGLGTHTASPQPPVSCEVAGVDAEGTLSWLSRKAAQGLVKASQKGYEMSVQGWRELTYPSPPSTNQSHQRNASSDRDLFPPTNGPADDPKRLSREPALVSLIDLQKLVMADEQRIKQPQLPMATFALVEGCNHLSFSPEGLRLLTIDRKGEMSTIWDLSYAAYGNAKIRESDDSSDMERGPHVKHLYRVERSSPSVALDSAWSRDGDWLALLSAQGTIHLHDVSSMKQSKRKRRSVTSATTAEKSEPTVSMSHGMSPPSSNAGFWGSVVSGVQTVSQQVNALRTQNALPTSFAGFRETAAAARSASGRAVAKGLSQGYSAAKSGASDMWHAEDNKVRHKELQDAGGIGSLRWIRRQGDTSILVVCGGAVHLHPVQSVTRRKGKETVTGLKQDKYGHKTFALPRISTSRDGTVSKPSKCTEEGPHGYWSLRKPVSDDAKPIQGVHTNPALPASNDVETNPPYCPFHVDSRVSIYAYEDDSIQAVEQQAQGHGLPDEEPWVFGEPLPPSILMNDHATSDFSGEGAADEDVEALADQVESRLTVHKAGSKDGGDEIRVSTRRARPTEEDGEEGGAFGLLGDDDSMI